MAPMIKMNDKIQTITSEEQAWHKMDDRVDKINFDNSPVNYTIIERYPQLYLNGKSSKIVPNEDDEVSEQDNVFKKYLIGQRAGGKEWVISCVNDTFETLAGSELWTMMEMALDGFDHTVSTCGTLRNGKRQFISARLNGLGDNHNYLTFLNGLDGAQALTTYSSSVRPVCENTVRLGLQVSEDAQAKKHTKNLRDIVPHMIYQIRYQIENIQNYESKLIDWDKVKLSDADAQSLIVGVCNKDNATTKVSTQSINRSKQVYHLFRFGRGNAGQSLSDVFNGFTEYHTHFSRQQRRDDTLKQRLSSEFGIDADIKSDLFNLFTDEHQINALADKGFGLIKSNQLVIA